MRFGLIYLFCWQYKQITSEVSTKTIYEINMCKSQYKKIPKKRVGLMEGYFLADKRVLVNSDNTIFVISVIPVCMFSVLFTLFLLATLMSLLRLSRFGFSFFIVECSLFFHLLLVSLILYQVAQELFF